MENKKKVDSPIEFHKDAGGFRLALFLFWYPLFYPFSSGRMSWKGTRLDEDEMWRVDGVAI